MFILYLNTKGKDSEAMEQKKRENEVGKIKAIESGVWIIQSQHDLVLEKTCSH